MGPVIYYLVLWPGNLLSYLNIVKLELVRDKIITFILEYFKRLSTFLPRGKEGRKKRGEKERGGKISFLYFRKERWKTRICVTLSEATEGSLGGEERCKKEMERRERGMSLSPLLLSIVQRNEFSTSSLPHFSHYSPRFLFFHLTVEGGKREAFLFILIENEMVEWWNI